MMSVGLRLRSARKARKLTQVQLAAIAGVQQASISELETGESKSLRGKTLLALSNALRVSPDWLAYARGPMEYTKIALPEEALKVARDWLTLAPEIRARTADMLREMAEQATRYGATADDKKVAAAYGRPPASHQPKAAHKRRA